MATVPGSLIGGVILGLRLRAFILIPAIIASVLVIGTGTAVRNQSSWSTLWAMFEALLAVRIGYLIGISAANVAARTFGCRDAQMPAAPSISNPAG